MSSKNFYYRAKRSNSTSTSVVGLASVGTVCQSYGTGVVESRTSSAPWIMAHEIGHVLNMNHDDQTHVNQECTGDTIMRTEIETNRVKFSHCSRENFRILLDAKYTDGVAFQSCFNQTKWPPADGFDFKQDTRQPGEIMSAEDQCRFSFGDIYKPAYDYTSIGICPMLYCRHRYWILRSGPALTGTICAVAVNRVFRCNYDAKCV